MPLKLIFLQHFSLKFLQVIFFFSMKFQILHLDNFSMKQEIGYFNLQALYRYDSLTGNIETKLIAVDLKKCHFWRYISFMAADSVSWSDWIDFL